MGGGDIITGLERLSLIEVEDVQKVVEGQIEGKTATHRNSLAWTLESFVPQKAKTLQPGKLEGFLEEKNNYELDYIFKLRARVFVILPYSIVCDKIQRNYLSTGGSLVCPECPGLLEF